MNRLQTYHSPSRLEHSLRLKAKKVDITSVFETVDGGRLDNFSFRRLFFGLLMIVAVFVANSDGFALIRLVRADRAPGSDRFGLGHRKQTGYNDCGLW